MPAWIDQDHLHVLDRHVAVISVFDPLHDFARGQLLGRYRAAQGGDRDTAKPAREEAPGPHVDPSSLGLSSAFASFFSRPRVRTISAGETKMSSTKAAMMQKPTSSPK